MRRLGILGEKLRRIREGIRSLDVILMLLLPICLAGCAAEPIPAGSAGTKTHLASSHFVSPDGSIIPLRTFLPEGRRLKALVIALHGFNDYSRAFATVGPYLASRDIGLIAYDQRGFGLSGATGLWAGASRYVEDLEAIIRAAKLRHPETPIYILGESMGAAVVIATFGKDSSPSVDGVVLSAPAVWSRETMPWYQSMVLEIAAVMVPDLRLTGSGLRVQASDNIEMLKGLGRDPWVIKATRIDAIYGLADLMDTAQIQADQVRVPVLILYGGKDEIIPSDPVLRVWRRLSAKPLVRAAYYPSGYHLLLRDLDASIALQDLAGWIIDRSAPLVSGCELPKHGKLSANLTFQVSEACLSGRAVSKSPVADPK